MPRNRPSAASLALGGVLTAAAANFLWQLGTSSYYVDEALSIDNALPSFGHVITLVNRTESNPWTYFLLLHEWLTRTGSQSEWATRLPSAIAGVALVGAVFWLARALLPTAAALGAAALCAVSPLVLQYAQLVRAYVFVMLAVTLAVGATVRAVYALRAQSRLLVLGALASIAALWLHYAAVLVIGPLCVWLAGRATVCRRGRAGFICAAAAAEFLAAPVFVEQYRNSGGLRGIATFSFTNILAVGGTPFDGRFVSAPTAIRIVAMLVVATALYAVFRNPARVREPRLLVTLAVLPVFVVLIGGLLGKDVVSTRYTAVAAPLLAVVVAAAVATMNRAWAIGLSSATLFVCAWGLLLSHSKGGFYPPSRQTMEYIAAHRQPGDVIAIVARGGVQWPYELYGGRLLHPAPEYIDPADHHGLLTAMRARRRVWIISEARARQYGNAVLLRAGTLLFGPLGYRPLAVHTATTTWTSVAYLVAPQTAVPRPAVPRRPPPHLRGA